MRRVELALWSAACLLAGCAAPWAGRPMGDAPAPLFRDATLSAAGAAAAIELGRSRKDEVEQRLGPAEHLAFDSGWEVWVYRAREQPRGADAGELVLLFDPQGAVRQLRVRPAHQAPAR